MAIHSPEPAAPQGAAPIDIEAWTEQATAALGAVTISAPGGAPLGTTTVSLQIPLDDVETRPALASHTAPVGAAAAKEGGFYKRKEPVRRDSLKRREALLKGKEGSKRRLRWENGVSPSPSSHVSFHAPRELAS
jgi:hypothetical protein